MTAFEWFGILTGVATLMGTAIVVYSHYNNKALKEGFRQMHDEMQAGFRVLALLIMEKDDEKRATLLTRLFSPSPSA